ncbi:hypothetical protein ACFQ10_53030 [Streptomyces indonesiensis]
MAAVVAGWPQLTSRPTALAPLTGAQTWAGLGIFADNLHRMTVACR